MEPKTDFKVKYYLWNSSTDPNYFDFSIPINEFEEFLNATLKIVSIAPVRNNYKIYGIDNKYFRVQYNGHCYGYQIKKQNMTKINCFYQLKTKQSQIYNDDFAGLKIYWIEELYEDIIFKLDENMSLTFSKMTDIQRGVTDYSVFLEPKNASTSIEPYEEIISKIKLMQISSCSISE